MLSQSSISIVVIASVRGVLFQIRKDLSGCQVANATGKSKSGMRNTPILQKQIEIWVNHADFAKLLMGFNKFWKKIIPSKNTPKKSKKIT